MLGEAPAIIRMFLRFMALPYYFLKGINWKHCARSKIGVIGDLLFIFFHLRYYPDNYSPCRLWEKDRKSWGYYFGSSYNPYQRKKLRRIVQRYEYQILFNDKVVCEQLCRGMDVKMPRTLGIIGPDEDYRQKIIRYLNDVSAEKLIIKPILGHAGMGIVVAIKTDSGILIDKRGNKRRLEDFKLNEASIVQEIIEQDARIGKISSSSVNTVRVVTMYTKKEDVIIVSSSMRFGVTAYVDNWSAGGVAVGVNYEEGTLKKIAYDKLGNQFTRHPVSGVLFEGFKIPHWQQVIDIAIKVQNVCPFYRLIGMDIAISKEGPVLIEVNANTDIVFQEQTSGPLFQDPRILKEFNEYDLLVNAYQKQLARRQMLV